LISGFAAVTVEAWADYGALPANCYLFSFGNTDGSGAGENYIFCAPQAARITISSTDPGYDNEENATSAGWSGLTNLYVAAIYYPAANYLALYTNGVLAGYNGAVTNQLTSVSNVLSYLGRSLYTSDPYAPVHVSEFRVWNGALTAPQVALDAAAGPGQIPANVGSLQAVHVTVATPMTAGHVYSLAPGGTAPAVANLQAQGSVQQAAVTGDFASLSNVNLLTFGGPVLTSGNTSLLTISSNGLVTAVGSGTTTITATFGGLSATQSVTVAQVTNTFLFDSFGDGFWSLTNQGNGKALVANAGGSTQEAPTNGATEQQYEVLYNYQNSSFRLRQQSSWRRPTPVPISSGSSSIRRIIPRRAPPDTRAAPQRTKRAGPTTTTTTPPPRCPRSLILCP
jgi:hypothetical protein